MARRVLVVAAIVVGFVAVVVATPAGAEIKGPCTGSGAFEKGTKARGPFTESAETIKKGQVIEVPVNDVVHWKGAISDVGPDRRDISGSVSVDLPWPFGAQTIDDWDKTTVATDNEGQHVYSLPSVIPRGVELEVSGEHSENGSVVCTGSVLVKVEGSAFDTPLTPAALAGLGVSGLALLLSGRPVFKKLWAKDDA